MMAMQKLVWGLLVLYVAAASPPRYTRQAELDNYDSISYDVGLDNLNVDNQDVYDYYNGVDEPQIEVGTLGPDEDTDPSYDASLEEEEEQGEVIYKEGREERRKAEGREDKELPITPQLFPSGSGESGTLMGPNAQGEEELRLTPIDTLQISGDMLSSGDMSSGASGASGDLLSASGSVGSGASGDISGSDDHGSEVSGHSGLELTLISGGEEELHLTHEIIPQTARQGVLGIFDVPDLETFGLPDISGESWASGLPEMSGESGASGIPEVSGESRASGIPEVSGESGASGVPEVSGESGASGLPEVSGESGVPEVSGASELPEVSGESGASGVSGETGTSGVPEISGEPGPFEVSGEIETLEASRESVVPEESIETGMSEVSLESGESGSLEEFGVTEAPEVTTEILIPDLEEEEEILITTLATPQEGTGGEIGSGVPDIDTHTPGMPTCVLCTCLVGSVYCDNLKLDRVPPLPKETTHFYARYNKISRISKSDFANLNKLKRIDLTSNGISRIDDDAFFGLPALEDLILRENNIRQLPALPPQMTLIDASHNQLGSTGIQREAFTDMPGLLYLYLTDNNIDHVPVPLPDSLRSLHLQNNNVQMIHEDTFCNPHDLNYIRSALEDIRLDGNPINLSRTPQAYICLPRIPIGALI
ncbi:epiphycan isoform X2 [Myxocyprinus asiaticus]|uniref:epiphycan isoform X2 n=1 Tax=Myxocyprinus asiaticus TaxID=70543 RepID=UPI0022219B7E|nr:epiphycan isoform X2 [Myxocyprinus asiaticus]